MFDSAPPRKPRRSECILRKPVKAAIAATLLGVTALAVVEPAQARGDTGAAIAAGIIGLGVGAAIASDHPHYREVQYYYAPPRSPMSITRPHNMGTAMIPIGRRAAIGSIADGKKRAAVTGNMSAGNIAVGTATGTMTTIDPLVPGSSGGAGCRA